MPTIFFIAFTNNSNDNDISTKPPVACNAVPSFLLIALHNAQRPVIVTPNATSEDNMLLKFTLASFWSALTNKLSDTENASNENILLFAPGIAFARAVNATSPPAILASMSKRV